jgi:hypothetical protein
MLGWIKKASEKAQRRNIDRSFKLLVDAAAAADDRLMRSPQVMPDDVARVTSLQKSLLMDLIGPVSVDDLRKEYLEPLLSNSSVSEGTKMAVSHVFDSASRKQ